jgi:NADH-quinone oxidoreductase subunit N
VPVDFRTIVQLWPEIVLILMASWILVGGSLKWSRMTSKGWSMVALGAYAVAALALITQHQTHWGEHGAGALFRPTGPLTVDYLGYSCAWLALLVGVLFTLAGGYKNPASHGPEFLGLLMVLVVGIMLVGAANDVVLLFVGLEMVSIPTYALLYFSRRDRAVGEATAKYFYLSILASALLLYGMSFLYGMAGTTLISGGEFETGYAIGIREALAGGTEEASGGLRSLVPVALVLIFAGLGFKLAAAPFHFYAPDVYQGVSNANAGLLAAAPKVVGAVALVKLGYVAVSLLPGDFAWQLALVVSMLTMTIGNICGLWQQNVRRLLAYSSIAHSGYILIGLAAATEAPVAGVEFPGGVAGMLFYLLVYVAASAGSFAALAWLGEPGREVSGLAELAGLGRTRPLAAAVLALCMFSLSGIPPLAGFWGKFTLFNSAIKVAVEADDGVVRVWFTTLAIVAALNAAIGAAYYLRVVATMYFGAPAASPAAPSQPAAQGGFGALAAMGMCGVLVLAVGVIPGRFVRYADLAERSIAPGVGTPAEAKADGLAKRAAPLKAENE